MTEEPLREVREFLAEFPDTQAVDVIFADLAGVVRGKRYPVADLSRIFGDGLAFPASSFLLDTAGANTDAGGRGFSDGDPDCLAVPIPDTLDRVPWSAQPLAQVLLTCRQRDGQPLFFEPRNVLARVAQGLKSELGLTACVAFELEFYLIDRARGAEGAPQPPFSPATGERDRATQVYGMDQVDAFGTVLTDIVESCRAQGVPTGAISAEYAPGQFEINLRHVEDPLAAADDCVLFKRAVKGVARKYDMQATFMAKPYPGEAGNGMHLHISLFDGQGRNVLDDGQGGISDSFRHALGGLLATLPEAMAFLAPNINSYRRYQPDIFVPIRRSWAEENRSVALRVPLGSGSAKRVEHRMPGADANPYLTLAALLAGMHHGIAHQLDPGPPASGNAATAFDPGLPMRPRRALQRLRRGKLLRDYLGKDYVDLYVQAKEAEYESFEAAITPQEYQWYLLAD
ncbi:puuA [Symbiodinium necroappetens]|uniref:PuuA protein n=1 Tax=Symbiodinium necroappetens TaxID=1628268 RepID=A0A813A3C7_9DINO|nr:puuA [Symbiodinium necroappetens]